MSSHSDHKRHTFPPRGRYVFLYAEKLVSWTCIYSLGIWRVINYLYNQNPQITALHRDFFEMQLSVAKF
jgi:hypothetical protein